MGPVALIQEIRKQAGTYTTHRRPIQAIMSKIMQPFRPLNNTLSPNGNSCQYIISPLHKSHSSDQITAISIVNIKHFNQNMMFRFGKGNRESHLTT